MYVTCVGNVDSNVQDWVSRNIVGRVKMITSGCQYHINFNPTHVDYVSERDSSGCVVKATIDGCWIESQSIKMTGMGDLIGGDKFRVSYIIEVERYDIIPDGIGKVFGTNKNKHISSCDIEFDNLKEFKNFISNGFLKVSCDAYNGIVLSVRK